MKHFCLQSPVFRSSCVTAQINITFKIFIFYTLLRNLCRWWVPEYLEPPNFVSFAKHLHASFYTCSLFFFSQASECISRSCSRPQNIPFLHLQQIRASTGSILLWLAVECYRFFFSLTFQHSRCLAGCLTSVTSLMNTCAPFPLVVILQMMWCANKRLWGFSDLFSCGSCRSDGWSRQLLHLQSQIS